MTCCKLVAVLVYRVALLGPGEHSRGRRRSGGVESSEPLRSAAGRHRLPAANELRRPRNALPLSPRSAGLSGRSARFRSTATASGSGGIKESLKRLKRGEMVLIFPEGTRTRDGEIAPFRPGFTALAVRSNAAILPVAVEGAFQVWPRWKKFPGLGRIRVHYGEPILPCRVRRPRRARTAGRSRTPGARMSGHPAAADTANKQYHSGAAGALTLDSIVLCSMLTV